MRELVLRGVLARPRPVSELGVASLTQVQTHPVGVFRTSQSVGCVDPVAYFSQGGDGYMQVFANLRVRYGFHRVPGTAQRGRAIRESSSPLHLCSRSWRTLLTHRSLIFFGASGVCPNRLAEGHGQRRLIRSQRRPGKAGVAVHLSHYTGSGGDPESGYGERTASRRAADSTTFPHLPLFGRPVPGDLRSESISGIIPPDCTRGCWLNVSHVRTPAPERPTAIPVI